MKTVRLRELFTDLDALIQPPASDPVLTGLSDDSKRVQTGHLFVAVRGTRHDGHAFLEEAILRGAAAVCVDRALLPAPQRLTGHVTWVGVPDTRAALSRIAGRFYGQAATRLALAAVTGTNGKTTTAFFLEQMLQAAGHRVGRIGTISHRVGDRVLPAANTTPGVLDLHAYFAQMVEHGLDWCVMEASSHALDQGRVAGLDFAVRLFTNLASDHLDYHQTREAYFLAKRRLFEQMPPRAIAVVNLDDPAGQRLCAFIRGAQPRARLVTYALNTPSDVHAEILDASLDGMRVRLETPQGRFEVMTSLIGRYNAYNLTAAAAGLLAYGLPLSAVQGGCAALHAVPGRLERVEGPDGVQVFVDYAHTEEALTQMLQALRLLTAGRLIVVFGCGGDRDRTKRPAMGQAAARLADFVIVTTDNPRSEDPRAIAQDVAAGFPQGFHQHRIELDRFTAIQRALGRAHAGDVVVIAGKGHEAYQILKETTVPFDDRESIRTALALARLAAAPVGHHGERA